MGQQQQRETRDNSGVMFRNDRKTEDKHPNVKGRCLIGGRWYWVSAWTKRKDDGEAYQSLAFEEMTDEKAEKYGGHRNPPAGGASGNGGQYPRSAQSAGKGEPPYGKEKVFEDQDIPF